MKQEEDFDANLAGEEGDTEETKRRWFRRIKKGITTSTKDKKGPQSFYPFVALLSFIL